MAEVIAIRFKIANAFLIIDEKVAIVDTGSPKDASTLFGAIDQAGIDYQDISLIIHTHAHFDHCGCTAELQNRTKAAVAVHRADAQYLSTGENAPIYSINLFGKILMPILARISQYPSVTPDIQFNAEFDLHPYGVEGKAIHTPGHTEGSMSILLDSREAIVGDLIGGGRLLGLIQPERPRYHHWYSDLPAAKKSLSKVLNFNPEQIYVGHGGPLKGSATKQYFGSKK